MKPQDYLNNNLRKELRLNSMRQRESEISIAQLEKVIEQQKEEIRDLKGDCSSMLLDNQIKEIQIKILEDQIKNYLTQTNSKELLS